MTMTTPQGQPRGGSPSRPDAAIYEGHHVDEKEGVCLVCGEGHPDNPATVPPRPDPEMGRAVDMEQYEATERWMRRQRLLSPFRSVWHRLLRHEVGRYACFTCDMDLPR